MKPLVSVIIPTYNMDRYVLEAVDSALSQTYKPLEIIVVDDGSADTTYSRLTPYIEQGNISYVFQENKGLATTRNTGIREAHGEYIAFLDADDLFLPRKIEQQVAFLETHPHCDISYCDLWHFFDGAPDRLFHHEYQFYEGNAILKKLLNKNFINPLSVVLRKQTIEHCGLFNEAYLRSEDWELWIRFAEKGMKFCFLKEKLAKYRMRRNGSLSHDFEAEVQRKETTLSIFIKLKQTMSWKKQAHLLFPWYMTKQWCKLVYAKFAARYKALRRLHLWLQTRRLKQAS